MPYAAYAGFVLRTRSPGWWTPSPRCARTLSRTEATARDVASTETRRARPRFASFTRKMTWSTYARPESERDYEYGANVRLYCSAPLVTDCSAVPLYAYHDNVQFVVYMVCAVDRWIYRQPEGIGLQNVCDQNLDQGGGGKLWRHVCSPCLKLPLP